MHWDLTLLILYGFTCHFTMHQKSHILMASVDFRVKLNELLIFVMHVERIATLLFLIWFGFRTVWYYPFILAALGYMVAFPMKIIEHTIKLHRNAWAVSISGIVFVPILLGLMVVHIINATSG